MSSEDDSFQIVKASESDIDGLVSLMEEFYAESDFTLDRAWAKLSFTALLEWAALGKCGLHMQATHR